MGFFLYARYWINRREFSIYSWSTKTFKLVWSLWCFNPPLLNWFSEAQIYILFPKGVFRIRDMDPFISASTVVGDDLAMHGSRTSEDMSLQWRHNRHDRVSNHHPRDCLLNRLFGRGSKQKSKLRVTGLCEGNSPVTGEFPTQRASNAENVFIWWRHHIVAFVIP